MTLLDLNCILLREVQVVEYVWIVGPKFVKTQKLLIHSPFLPQKALIRSIIVLTVMINVRFIYLIAKHVVNNIQVKLLTILEVVGTIINLRRKKLRKDTMENVKQKLLQVDHFLQPDHKKGLLKDVKVRLIDKTQRSEPIK